ncbi:MAG: hypothetical protein GY696_19640 [Gammaproteobacteria bacterium]|nr:hypothetical protein [Gammaproteobacteria bacterium]
MNLQLMHRICIEITSVATNLDWVRAQQKLNLPLVLRAALADVVEQREARQMFVRLQVQLEVGFKVSFIGTQLT